MDINFSLNFINVANQNFLFDLEFFSGYICNNQENKRKTMWPFKRNTTKPAAQKKTNRKKPRSDIVVIDPATTTTDYATKSELDKYARLDLVNEKLSKYLLTADLDAKMDARLPAKNTLVRTSDLNQYIPISRINEFVRTVDFDATGAFSKYALKTDLPVCATGCTDLNKYLLKTDATGNYMLKSDESKYLLKTDADAKYLTIPTTDENKYITNKTFTTHRTSVQSTLDTLKSNMDRYLSIPATGDRYLLQSVADNRYVQINSTQAASSVGNQINTNNFLQYSDNKIALKRGTEFTTDEYASFKNKTGNDIAKFSQNQMNVNSMMTISNNLYQNANNSSNQDVLRLGNTSSPYVFQSFTEGTNDVMRIGIRDKNANGIVDEVNGPHVFFRLDRDNQNKQNKITVRQPMLFSNEMRFSTGNQLETDKKYFKFSVDGNCLKLKYTDETNSANNKEELQKWCSQ